MLRRTGPAWYSQSGTLILWHISGLKVTHMHLLGFFLRVIFLFEAVRYALLDALQCAQLAALLPAALCQHVPPMRRISSLLLIVLLGAACAHSHAQTFDLEQFDQLFRPRLSLDARYLPGVALRDRPGSFSDRTATAVVTVPL